MKDWETPCDTSQKYASVTDTSQKHPVRESHTTEDSYTKLQCKLS